MSRPPRFLSWAGRTLPFAQPYFQPLSSSLKAGTQTIEDLLRLLRRAEAFTYAGILFRPLDDGWLCVSPRRADGSRRTQRLSWEEAEDLEELLQEVLAERLEDEARLASPEEIKPKASSENRSFWAELFRVLLDYFADRHRYEVIYWVRYSPRKQKQSIRPPPARSGARDRQTHGRKTVSRHFLRQQTQLELG